MEVRDLDFRYSSPFPCGECIVRVCCSKRCDSYYRFFTEGTLESFKLEFSKEIQDDLLSCQGISIEENSNGQEKKRRKNK
jgi:hypothetical protein